MKLALFCHSLQSDWGNDCAHFLRGIASALLDREMEVEVYEPFDAASLRSLIADRGEKPLADFRLVYPQLRSNRYLAEELDLDCILEGVDVVIVHDWNDPSLIRRIGRHRFENRSPYLLLFNDSRHRPSIEPEQPASLDLEYYDGVLASTNAIRDAHLEEGSAPHVWTWRLAADTRVFHPRPHGEPDGDVVWIADWSDEHAAAIREFLIRPAADLHLHARAFGARYPHRAVSALRASGVGYGGWRPNFLLAEIFARYRATVHAPAAPNLGAPSMRPFEALACAIPLISTPLNDGDHLFTPGEDFLEARDSDEMRRCIRDVLADRALAQRLAEHGLKTILRNHTCEHRAAELLSILDELRPGMTAIEIAGRCETECHPEPAKPPEGA
ncbi:MAG TPA: glycosyltransferase [Thermoanaerobaculia bacterium]|nr:glycosyltransferase [Thermoanaerobaculia bacterium]